MSKEITSAGLRRTNIIAGIFHLLQMVAVLALSSDFSLPITAKYMSGPPGSTYAEPVVLFNTPIGLTVAIFLGLSALAHFIVASPQFFPRYSAGLAQKRNYFRWVEYSISSSVMIVLISQLVGVSDLAAIISIFGVNASMILFGWLQEKYETPGNGGWVPFIFGCIAGIVPWLGLVFYVLAIGDQQMQRHQPLSTESLFRSSYSSIPSQWFNTCNTRRLESGLITCVVKRLI